MSLLNSTLIDTLSVRASFVSASNGGIYNAVSNTDEVQFELTVIRRNASVGWNTTIEGVVFNGNYSFRPILSNGPVINFTIADQIDPSCNISVSVNGARSKTCRLQF